MAGKKTGKRLLTWVLVLVMALSLLPLNALAEEADEADALQMSDEDNSGDRSLMPAKTTYTITFNANGGTFADGTVEYDGKYSSRDAAVRSQSPKDDPTRPPYVFEGWYKKIGIFEKDVDIKNVNVSDVLIWPSTSRTLYAKWSLPDNWKVASIFYLKDPTKNRDSNTGADWSGPLGGTTAGFVDTTGFSWVESPTNSSVYNSKNVQPDDVTWPAGYGTTNENGLELKKGTDEWNAIFEAFKEKVEKDNGVGILTKDDVDSITLVPYKVSRGNQTDGDYHVDCDVVIKCNFVTVDFMVKNDSNVFASILEDGKLTWPKNTVFPEGKAPIAPEKDGYEFDGWYTNEEFKEKADFNTKLTEDTTFYGKYEPVKTYTVTYTDGVGGEVFKDQVTSGLRKGTDTPAFNGDTPTRKGYEFKGWNPTVAKTVTEDATYTAQWTKDSSQWFNVKYDANGGTGTVSDNTEYLSGTEVTVMDGDGLKKDGYDFTGWNTEANGNGTAYAKGNTFEITGNTTLYAQWKAKEYSFTVNYLWDNKPIPNIPSTTGSDALGAEVIPNTDIDGYTLIFNQPQSMTIGTGKNELNLNYRKNVTLTANSDSVTYDGKAHTVTGYTSAPDKGVTFEGITATGSGTNAGEYDVKFVGESVVGTYNDLYIVTAANSGTLTITEASAPTPVTINLSDYIKKDLTVIGSGFQGETFTVKVKGSPEDGGGCFTGSVMYAANEKGVKPFNWEVTEQPTGDNYVFNTNGTITFKKENRIAYSFTVDEAKGRTEEMDYDGNSYSFNVWVSKKDGKLMIKETSAPITLNNDYSGTFPVALGQYIKKVYKSECSCAPKTTFRFEALIEESGPEANALSLIESVPVEKESKVYTAKGSVTLKAGTEQTVDMSIQLPVGFYEVTLKEVNDKTANVKYDKTVYTFVISVLEYNGNVKIGFSDVKKDGKEYNEQGFVFTNSYVHSHFIPVSPTHSKPTLNTGDHYAYVMGYPDGTVRPNGSITRAEVSAILFRLLSDKTRDEYFTTESSFTDVKAGAWYNNSIATLEKAGVIVDTAKGGAFRPNEAITRAELAAMLAQFSDAKPVKGVKFSDVPAEHWAYEAIAIAAKMGWIEGYPDGTFRPDATITRAEMMTLVNRALERVPSDEDHLLSKRVMLTFPDCKSGDWFYIAVQEATNSHTYERAATEKNGDEQWTALRANRDWTQLEK